MTQLKRWLEDEIPADIARMLRAGQAERPRKRALERAVVALGATSALASITSTAVGASSKAIGGVGSLTAKWTLVSVLGLGVAATAVVTVHHYGTEPKVLPVSAATSVVAKPSFLVPARSQVKASREPLEPLHEETVAPRRSTPSPVAATGKRNGVTVAPVVPPSSVGATPKPDDSVPTVDAQLAQEMQFIDRARTAMRAGNPALCLQILEEYRVSFERHRLGPESAYLRMQAAQKMGDRAMAMEVAREILRRYPSSPHVGRAEELLQRESEVPDSL